SRGAELVRRQRRRLQDVAAVRTEHRRSGGLGDRRAGVERDGGANPPAMTRPQTEPCLLWTSPNGGCAGNVLRAGVLARVLELVGEARVVLVSPLIADPSFTAEFAHPRVSFEPLPPHVPAGPRRRARA